MKIKDTMGIYRTESFEYSWKQVFENQLKAIKRGEYDLL